MKPEPRIESLNGQISQVVSRSILLVGRHPECDLHLNHPCVSRRHCCIILSDNDLYIRDLGSRHGVWVNGERVAERQLTHGDQIAVAPFYFRVLMSPVVPEDCFVNPGTRQNPPEPLKESEINSLTDLETMIPHGSKSDQSANSINQPELIQNEVQDPIDQAIEKAQQIRPHEEILEAKSSDLLDELHSIDIESNDSGYEPIFDLKL